MQVLGGAESGNTRILCGQGTATASITGAATATSRGAKAKF